MKDFRTSEYSLESSSQFHMWTQFNMKSQTLIDKFWVVILYSSTFISSHPCTFNTGSLYFIQLFIYLKNSDN